MNQTKHEQLSDDHFRLALHISWVSLVLNGVLFAFKYIVGVQTESISISADAWHTLSDSMTTIIVLLGLYAARKPADSEHPFGHGRIELIAALVIGVLLAVVALNTGVEAVHSLRSGKSASFGLAAKLVMGISIAVKELMAQLAFWGARRTKNRALRADGWHHRSDAIASLVVFVGLFIQPYLWWMDGVLGFVVAGLIIYAAYQIVRDATNPLLGEPAKEDLHQRIAAVAEEVCGRDVRVHHLHIHRYGTHTELTFHIHLPAAWTLQRAHALATKIEHQLRDIHGYESTIHVEPN